MKRGQVWTAPDDANGLTSPSRLMVDKVVTIGRDKLGRRLGRLADADRARLDRCLLVFLGLADRAGSRSAPTSA